MVEPERRQMIIWRRVACWISNATRAQAHARVRVPTRARTHSRTHTEKNCNLCCFSTATWTHLNIRLYPHCFSYIFCCLFSQAVCFCSCVCFSFTLNDEDRSCFQDYTPLPRRRSSHSNGNLCRSSSISSLSSVTLPTPTPPSACSFVCNDCWRSSQRIYTIKFRQVNMVKMAVLLA